MIRRMVGWAQISAHGVDLLAPIFDLAIRLYVASVFFKSGLVKVQSWESTVALFENEYAVPVLPPELAAYMGTATELIVPVFLVLGLGGRFAALVLFVFNIIAATSYPTSASLASRTTYCGDACSRSFSSMVRGSCRSIASSCAGRTKPLSRSDAVDESSVASCAYQCGARGVQRGCGAAQSLFVTHRLNARVRTLRYVV